MADSAPSPRIPLPKGWSGHELLDSTGSAGCFASIIAPRPSQLTPSPATESVGRESGHYDGADSFQDPVDRSPNGNQPYRVHKRTIPNLPWPVLPVFAGGLIVSLLVLGRRFRPGRQDPRSCAPLDRPLPALRRARPGGKRRL